jgi:hypothetical protein
MPPFAAPFQCKKPRVTGAFCASRSVSAGRVRAINIFRALMDIAPWFV